MGIGRRAARREWIAAALVFGMLALGGGALAAALAVWTSGMFTSFFPPIDVPISLQVHFDLRVLFVTLGLAILTGLLFGILPAWRSSNLGNSPARSSMRSRLIVFDASARSKVQRVRWAKASRGREPSRVGNSGATGYSMTSAKILSPSSQAFIGWKT